MKTLQEALREVGYHYVTSGSNEGYNKELSTQAYDYKVVISTIKMTMVIHAYTKSSSQETNVNELESKTYNLKPEYFKDPEMLADITEGILSGLA